MRKLRITATLLVAAAMVVSAVKVEKINIREYAVFQKGRLEGTRLDSRGRLGLGPDVAVIKGPEAEFYLAAAEAENGDIYVGTGHQAQVFRISRQDGKATAIFSAEQPDIYGLLMDKEGDLIVATSPNGKLFRVGSDQKAEVLLDPEDKFIWDIARDNAGNIYCVTGNSGGVYQVNSAGQAAKIFAPDDAHLISLAIGRDNSLLVGSGDRGILYSIKDRKAQVLYDSPLEEVRGICQDSRGEVFFAVTHGARQRRSGNNGDLESLMASPKKEKKTDAYTRLKSVVYHLHSDGAVEEIWSSRDDMVYSMVYDPKADRMLLGTGHTGRIYSLKRDGDFSLLYESESAQVYKIIAAGDGFICVSNNTARLALLKHTARTQGTYVSDVFDLQAPSRLGRLYWELNGPGTAGATFFVRAGNSSAPDSTWTEWSPPFSDPQQSQVNLKGFRYVQIKVAINSAVSADSLAVNSLSLYYVQSNVKPKIAEIAIKKSVAEKKEKTKTEEPPPRRKLTISWRAADVNGDSLKYNLFLRKLGQRAWFRFRKDLLKKSTHLFPEMYEDGRYVLRLVADDSLHNSPGTGLSDEMISHPFTIDSTSPQLSGWQRTGDRVRFSVTDSVSPVAEVLYTFDGKLWYALAPTDMINDSLSESFDFQLDKPAGAEVVFIKVIDAFGNQKVYQKEL